MFSDLEMDKVGQIMTEKDYENTRKATKVSSKLFREYLQKKGISETFEEFDSKLVGLKSLNAVKVYSRNGTDKQRTL